MVYTYIDENFAQYSVSVTYRLHPANSALHCAGSRLTLYKIEAK
ncbi:hypothetical protein SPHINGO8BC_50950 [Sphingobacterium multivorum]|uniref:Uncharacterized protein n=1 Tax=Sphingobacterium multivorum TaxID=28454 RepID=A0A654CLY0_SPHMU|nr:hypothetical protein SPHINGO8BC_50950 [Sphingobacterium multivorum]